MFFLLLLSSLEFFFFLPLTRSHSVMVFRHFITNISYFFDLSEQNVNWIEITHTNTHTNNNNENSSFFFFFLLSLLCHVIRFNSWFNVYLLKRLFVCTCCRFIFLCWISYHKKMQNSKKKRENCFVLTVRDISERTSSISYNTTNRSFASHA